ncbi:hypothetical protein HWV62_30865 [Athelia sp. TMB]|nr:hypothetical protein HWV62_30865 [Athelia sp. TMB]
MPAAMLPSLLADLATFATTFPASLLPQPDTYPAVFLPALLLFVLLFHVVLATGVYATRKQRAWVLTTVAAAIMTGVSVPFVWDYAAGGADVRAVRTLPALSYATCRVFQAYLIADLTMGVIYYREQVGALTGWFHHTLYLFVVNTALSRGWAHMFCMCAAMELPTLLLGAAALHPRLRSNLAFAAAFFATRIAMHAVWAAQYALAKPGGSWMPALVLGGVFPLHVLWFKACLAGFVRRWRALHPTPTCPVVVRTGVAPLAPAHSIHLGGYRVRTPLAPAFLSRANAPAALANWRNHPARQHLVRGRGRLRKVYDFVGLGLARGGGMPGMPGYREVVSVL